MSEETEEQADDTLEVIDAENDRRDRLATMKMTETYLSAALTMLERYPEAAAGDDIRHTVLEMLKTSRYLARRARQ
jgi:hypothetical protein